MIHLCIAAAFVGVIQIPTRSHQVATEYLIDGRVNVEAVHANSLAAVRWLERHLQQPAHARNFGNPLSKDLNFSAGSIGVFNGALLHRYGGTFETPAQVWQRIRLMGRVVRALSQIPFESSSGAAASKAPFFALSNACAQSQEILPAFHGINPRVEEVTEAFDRIQSQAKGYLAYELGHKEDSKRRLEYRRVMISIRKDAQVITKM